MSKTAPPAKVASNDRLGLELPDPWDYCYEWDGPYGTRKFSAAQHNGNKPTRSVPLFTAAQMHAYAAEASAVMRERCAACAAAATLLRRQIHAGANDLPVSPCEVASAILGA